jgi:phage shock protein PspC (stress-responsive transcriptional regulator)
MSEVYRNIVTWGRRLSILSIFLVNFLFLLAAFFGNPHYGLGYVILGAMFSLITVPLAALFLILTLCLKEEGEEEKTRKFVLVGFWSSLLFPFSGIPIFGTLNHIFFAFWFISFLEAFKREKTGVAKYLYWISTLIVLLTLIMFFFVYIVLYSQIT